MSNTPRAADDCMKLLDAGYTILMFKNGMGSYTAVGLPAADTAEPADGIELNEALQDALSRDEETDDFTPSQALYRLTEKLTTGRIA